MPLGSNNPTVARYQALLEEVGRASLHSLFPNDFEVYICSLELVDSTGIVVDFFVFPIMPTGFNQTESSLTNIKKTAGGITTLNTDTFVPVDINLQGDFGRRLKILIGQSNIDARAINFSSAGGVFTKESLKQGATQLKKAVFSSQIKSGYGCIKILQSIYDRAHAVDSLGNPYKLYFYNLALGSSYLVRPMNLVLSQSYDSNMIWKYNLTMKGIAPIDTSSGGANRDSLIKSMQYGALSKIANITANEVLSTLKQIPSNIASKQNGKVINTVNSIVKKRL